MLPYAVQMTGENVSVQLMESRAITIRLMGNLQQRVEETSSLALALFIKYVEKLLCYIIKVHSSNHCLV